MNGASSESPGGSGAADPDRSASVDAGRPADATVSAEQSEPADSGEASSPVAGVVAEAPEQRLERRVVPAWILSGLFGVAVLATIAALVLTAFADRLGDELGAFRVLAIVVFGLMALWSVVMPPLAWRRWAFRVGSELLLVRHGVVFLEEKAIPTSRLQHVDLTRGPIERAFGLATLVVFTAGSEAATFRLPGLTPARAEELRDRILQARGDDVV